MDSQPEDPGTQGFTRLAVMARNSSEQGEEMSGESCISWSSTAPRLLIRSGTSVVGHAHMLAALTLARAADAHAVALDPVPVVAGAAVVGGGGLVQFAVHSGSGAPSERQERLHSPTTLPSSLTLTR